MQSIISIEIFTSKIMDLGEGGPFQKWQRAVNRQPGYRSGNSKGSSASPLSFFIFQHFQKCSKKYQKCHPRKKFQPARTLRLFWHFEV
jgi:hypothetical protein